MIPNADIPEETIRRKRLKVVSACAECRRRKTKCSGGNPCSACTKAKAECRYVSSKSNMKTTQAALTTAPAVAAAAAEQHFSPTTTCFFQEKQYQQSQQPVPQHHRRPSSVTTTTTATATATATIAQGIQEFASSSHHRSPLPVTRHSFSHFSSISMPAKHHSRHTTNMSAIASIEERLTTIERILRLLLTSTHTADTPDAACAVNLSSSSIDEAGGILKRGLHPYSHSPETTDINVIYRSSSSSENDSSFLRLPPLSNHHHHRHYQHHRPLDSFNSQLRSSSSSSPSSSSSSSSSPSSLSSERAMTSLSSPVRHLLNDTETSTTLAKVTGFKRPHDTSITKNHLSSHQPTTFKAPFEFVRPSTKSGRRSPSSCDAPLSSSFASSSSSSLAPLSPSSSSSSSSSPHLLAPRSLNSVNVANETKDYYQPHYPVLTTTPF